MVINVIPVEAKKHLIHHGWCFFRQEVLSNNLERIAFELGQPIKNKNDSFVETLIPKESTQAKKHTTSSFFGLGEFPPHTDMAHWEIPPKFLIMRAKNPTVDCPTILIDTNKLDLSVQEKNIWERSLWKSTGYRNHFLTSIFFKHNGLNGFRWDTCTMIPYGKIATSIADEVSTSLQALIRNSPVIINWKCPEDILIVDNWRMAHMRPRVPRVSLDRTLERVLVKEKQ